MEALAIGRPLSTRARRGAGSREEELLGLLAGFPDGGEYGSGRELSFSDLVEAGAGPTSAGHGGAAPPSEAPKDHESATLPGRQEAASKQQQQAVVRERRHKGQRSGGSRGSYGGGADGVLLNFYVPGLLTRSMTAPRPGPGALPPGAGQGAPAKAAVAAGKARTQAPLGIGCWPALWGRSRGRDRRRPAKACS